MKTTLLVIAALTPSWLGAQAGHVHSATVPDSMQMASMADEAMGGHMDANMMKHMELSPVRVATRADSLKAWGVAQELKQAIAKYQDSSAAIADGYKMFLPNVKAQRVYHFTNSGRAILSAFRFNASKPTSLLYKRGDDGKLHLIGAMYTMPKNASPDRLNARIPLGIARWHKHVNWCLPKKGEEMRFFETKNGQLLFGPEGTIATKAECDAAGGNFHPTLLGWMVHVNVFEGNNLTTIFADEHR